MGFSALQGKGVHEALLARQDAEIRLIETMRRCLSQKAKCDRDYATAMVNVAQTGLKVDRGDDLSGSQIFQAWRKFMEEIEQQSKLVRSNAEHLETLCSERMAQLYQDKRKSRKQYQEEHAKIASQFAHLTEDVARKKAEYQKHLDYYKQLRMRFEEHYIKSGRAGRKLDDVRDKYQKACRKLHLAHNEYVLLIHEATEVEKDYRTILLPNLLENHQTQQENFITTWRNLLVEASNFGDMTSDKYIEIHKKIDSTLQSVNSSDEYRDFAEKHRTSPALPVIFRFDDQLIEDTVGKLQPNQLTVDNLTVDWLRQRLTDLESSIKDCQEKQSRIQSESNGKISSSSSSLPTSPAIIMNNPLTTSLNGMNGSSSSLKDLKFNKDLSSLKCEERQKNKLVEIIRAALNEVSCEELPSGCDDLTVEIENNNHEQATHSNHMSLLLQKGGNFMTLIKTPFKKKRSTVAGDGKRSPSTTPKSARGSTARSSSIGSSVNSYEESEVVVEFNLNASTKNIYADIDNGDTCGVAINKPIECETLPPELPAANVVTKDKLNVLQVSTINECENFEECVEVSEEDFLKIPNIEYKFNCSKNNLLLIDDHIMASSIDNHLNDIELINKNLDKLMETHRDIESYDKGDDISPEIKAEKTKLKKKIAEKIKILKEARMMSPSTSDASSKESFTSRVKNIFPKFEKQGSQEDQTDDSKKAKSGKGFMSSFKKKQIEHVVVDETDEDFEEIKKVPLESQTHLTDLDEKSKVEAQKISSKLKQKLRLNIKSTKNMISSKIGKKSTSNETQICNQCFKKFNVSPNGSRSCPAEALLDFNKSFSENDFCVCVDVDSLFDSDGVCIKNFEYKDMTIATNRPLYEEEWFHGVLPREEVVRLLRHDGDFLVRETTRNDESQTVLSVCWNGHKHFIVQITAEGHHRFEGPSFPSIQELILHQYQSESPVTSRSGAILKKPVLRERWELSNDDVILLDKIGRGNFGDVYKAKLRSTKKDVAVKTCRMTLPDEQKRKFLQEGRILKQYDHPNIVKLIGICVQKQPIMIVMELVEGGSLLMSLRKNAGSMDQRQMMSMCRDTAAGMRYLESKNCIHRDLAARNCLIGSENIVKISDFGMSREEEEYIVSDGMKQIPIKWTAPEALNFGKYTSLCDVWSYGVLIWEIFSRGGTPYAGMSNSKARERIDEGYRMPMPEGTPPEMYRLMLKCWDENPEGRPHFDEIFTVVDCLLSKKMSVNSLTNDLQTIRE